MSGKSSKDDGGFSAEERAAMKSRAAELKAQQRRARDEDRAAADAADVAAKISQMPEEDRRLAERVQAVVMRAAPQLSPKLYYGQPGFALDGKVVCFFRSGQMDKERYSTFGFSSRAGLDESSGVWSTSFALSDPSDEALERLGEVVSRAVE